MEDTQQLEKQTIIYGSDGLVHHFSSSVVWLVLAFQAVREDVVSCNVGFASSMMGLTCFS